MPKQAKTGNCERQLETTRVTNIPKLVNLINRIINTKTQLSHPISLSFRDELGSVIYLFASI